MSSAWERFDLLYKSGPDLALQDPILLQNFFIGLNKESREILNCSSNGSFLHLQRHECREILEKILLNKQENRPEENL